MQISSIVYSIANVLYIYFNISYVILRMDISKNIYNARMSSGLTQLQVAIKLGLEQSNYSRLESRGNKITIEQLQRIAEAIGVDISTLLGVGTGVARVSPREDGLIQRVAELEDRIKDKDALKEKTFAVLQEFVSCVTAFLNNLTDDYAINRRIGIIEIYVINGDETIEKAIPLSQIPKEIGHDFEAFFRSKYSSQTIIEKGLVLSKDEKRNILQKIINGQSDNNKYFIFDLYQSQLLQMIDSEWYIEMSKFARRKIKEENKFRT